MARNPHNAGTVHAHRGYLRESILDPSRRLVPGYAVVMPSYEGVLTNAQVDTLVEFIAHLPGTSDDPPRKTAVDTVCGMAVSVGPDTPHAIVGGVEHWFCSEECRARFRARPIQRVR